MKRIATFLDSRRLIRRILTILFLISVLLIACAKTETELPKKKKPIVGVEGQKQFYIGIVPEEQLFTQLERYEPLADYLTMKVGRKITFTILPRYRRVIDDFVSKKIDGAFLGSFIYALAHTKLGVEVLARPVNLAGISTYHGLIFVRKDSGIRTIKDMKGKTFVMAAKSTTAGYLLPLQFFRKNGITNYKAYFKETYFAGTHEDAILDVLNRKADIGAAKNTVFERFAAEDSRLTNELTLIARSPDVPENGLAVRKDLEQSIKAKLKEALLNMHNDADGRNVLKQFGAQKFIDTTDRDYDPVFSLAKEAGIDVATFRDTDN